MSGDPIELVLAKQANDAIAQGADPQAVTGRLHDMVAHLRANPDVAKMGADALAQGADPTAVSSRVYQLSQQGFGGHGAGRSFGDEPTKETFASYGAGSFPFVTKTKAIGDALIDKVSGDAPAGVMADYNRRYESSEAGRAAYQHDNPKKALTAAVLGNAIPAIATLGTSLAEGSAPTVAEGAAAAARGLGSKILRGIGTGAATGVVQGVSEGHGNAADYVDKIEHNALLGGAVGGAAPIVTGAAGSVLKRINAPDMIAKGAEKLGLSRIANTFGTKGAAADAVAARAESDRLAGFVPKAPTPGVPSLPLDQAGPDVQGLAEGIASRPGPGRSKIIGRITERQQQMRPSVTKALTEGTGVNPGAGISPLATELNVLKLKGDQAYAAARKATEGQAVESPTLAEVLKTDVGQDAYRWARARRGELPGGLPEDEAPAASATTAMPRAASEPPALPIRDEAGRLRRDLSNVSTDDLEKEWRRLAELNAEEEGQRGAVHDAGYRGAYEELPRTEKLGHVGKEDLPDADGAIDPEALLRDNKTVKGYNKNQIVRSAREKSMARINDELSGRPIADPNDFSFGANAETANAPPATLSQTVASKGLPDPETLHLMKRFLYQVSSGKMPGANTKQAAEAAGALNQWGKIRSELPESWQQADEIYARQARLVDASNTGRKIFQTRINPSVENPRKAVAKSLNRVRRDIAESSPEEQQAAQQGAGAAAHALFESAPTSVKAPGRIFARSPERVQQTNMAMKSPEAAQAFQKQVSAWDAIQEQANRLLGNSRTAARGAENAAAAPTPSVTQVVRHPLRAIGSVVKGNDAAKQQMARQKLDAAIADFLTGPDISSIPNAAMVARLRRQLNARTPYIAPIALAGGATAK